MDCVTTKGKQIAAEIKRPRVTECSSPAYWREYDIVDGAREAHRKAAKTLQNTFERAIRAGMSRPDAYKIFEEGSDTDKWAHDVVWPV